MSGTLDWSALPVVAEYLEVQDLDLLIKQLIAIRSYSEKQRGQ